jgi:hypothetical protein
MISTYIPGNEDVSSSLRGLLASLSTNRKHNFYQLYPTRIALVKEFTDKKSRFAWHSIQMDEADSQSVAVDRGPKCAASEEENGASSTKRIKTSNNESAKPDSQPPAILPNFREKVCALGSTYQ